MSTNFEDLVLHDTRANQPAAGIPGRRYFVSDEGVYERDNGSSWDPEPVTAADLDIASLSTTTPVSGDLVVVDRAGVRLAADVDDLPGGGGGAGALVYLESHAASSSATLDFTGLSDTYNDYLLKITGIRPASAGNNLLVQFATDNTPTWDTGNNYRWGRVYWNIAGASGGTGDGGATSSVQIGPAIGTTAGYSFDADIRLSNLRTAALFKKVNSRSENIIDADGNLYGVNTAGVWKDSTNKAYGIRLLMSSGNIASGAAYLYGIADS